MRRSVSVPVALITFVFVAFAQTAQIRTRVDLVVVPASVQDARGRLVHGLTEGDFMVFEDHVPQVISNFSADPQPLSAAVIVDTGMGGISMKRLVPLFTSVVAGFSPWDEMASFRYDHLVFQLSDFTSDQERIKKSFSIVKTIAQKQPPTVPAGNAFPTAPKIIQVLLGALGGGGASGGPISDPTRPSASAPTFTPPSRVLFDVLYEAAKVLETRPMDRRRIIFIISDGAVSGTNTHKFDEVADLLLRDNIEVFAVTVDGGAFQGRLGVLGSLARATGGNEYRGLNTSSMERAFNRITEEARNQYVLGYHSSNEVKDGMPTIRTIEVRGRDPKWRITHRKGYTQEP